MKEKIISEDSINILDIQKYATFIAKMLKNKDVVIMRGNLGYGKTTLTRYIAKELESESIVSSPSFTIINEYDIILEGKESVLRHIDLYRLESEDEIYSIGLDAFIYEDGVSIIEWGDKFIDFFNKPYYILEIENIDDDERFFRLLLSK